MKVYKYIIPCLLLGSFFLVSSSDKWNKNTPLSEVYEALGKTYPHKVEVTTEKIKQGKELIETGYITKTDGSKTKLQSKHFKCIHCHNTEREDPILTESNPDARLEYVKEKNLPLMTGSTLWGIVNRETWYNGDYIKKYGDLVKPAHKSLKESIHLCATQCSQGRDLEDWEMDVVLAYLYSIEMKLGDLGLKKSEWNNFKEAVKNKKNEIAIAILQSKYLLGSPATFEEDAYKLQKQETHSGNAINGKTVYDLACKTCHYQGGPAKYITLNNEKITFNLLEKHLEKHTKYSIYRAIRKGTYAHYGHRTYMPLFTKERLSDKQIEDLRAYIEEQATR